jgi:hypothetical protein
MKWPNPVLISAILAVAACGDPDALDLTGTWSGSIEDGATVDLVLGQDGTQITGSGVFSASPVTVTGAISERTTGLTFENPDWSVAYSGTILDADTISGTIQGGLFEGDELVLQRGPGVGDPDGGTDDPDASPATGWDEVTDDLVDAFCVHYQMCVPQPLPSCEQNVRAMVDDIRADLADDQEAACRQCLAVRSDALREIAEARCDENADDEAATAAACDLDHGADLDGDGDPGNDYGDACDLETPVF